MMWLRHALRRLECRIFGCRWTLVDVDGRFTCSTCGRDYDVGWEL